MSPGQPSETAIAPIGREFTFGPFRFQPERQLLLEGNSAVRIGGRALDILLALVERAGSIVTKEELFSRVWPNLVVEEGNLRTQIAMLRRALNDGRNGARYVVAVAGRGYRFVAPVSISAPNAVAAVSRSSPVETGGLRLPAPSSRIVGREDSVLALTNRLGQRRFVTIVGPGGIGKTTVAIAVGHALAPAFENQVSFVDLGPLGDPRLVPAAVASALGLTVNSADPIAGLVASLRERRLLLIFDCCEHVIEPLAALAEALFKAGPSVHMLATSREPLRVEGEHIYRLSPLSCPPAGSDLRATDILTFSAAQLFVERATAASDSFALTDAEVPAVAGICHRLDGIPLALELAAAGVDAFGVEGLASQLDRRLLLTVQGRRTAMPRHQTLRATIDWSYELLPEPERNFFCRLGTFAGSFTLEAAAAVAEGDGVTAVAALEMLVSLAAKSLISFDGSEPPGRWRLLETIRAYALEQLEQHGETQEARRRHAEYFRSLFVLRVSEASNPLSPEDLAPLLRELDDIRAALDWSFAPCGDVAIGIDLTAAFAQAWLHSSLVVECRERCERALRYCPSDRASHAAQRLQLLTGLGSALLVTMGPADQNVAVFTEALELAEQLKLLDTQARLLWGLGTLLDRLGDRRAKQDVNERFARVAHQIGDPGVLAVAERTLGLELLRTTGQLGRAQQAFERVLRYTAASNERRQTVWSLAETCAAARATLSMTLCLQGFAERAREEARASIMELPSDTHELAYCRVLSYGTCRVGLLSRNVANAAPDIERLIDLAARSNAGIWRIEGQFLKARLMIERQEFDTSLAVVRGAFAASHRIGWHAVHTEFQGILAEALAGSGLFEQALDVANGALASADRGPAWYLAELHRIKGRILLRQVTNQSAATAAECFRQAIDIAKLQGSVLFELRAATDLARLRLSQDRRGEAKAILAPVYQRFSEGFDTPDLQEAKAILTTS
jgi:predicted ATPase/DNA-binding winged helix-turn-helix (wHTH) protein